MLYIPQLKVRITNDSITNIIHSYLFLDFFQQCYIKGGVGKFGKPARDTLFVIFHGMLLTSR